MIDTIQFELQRQFGNFESKSFAIRSSAIGEDGIELSSAGQMETFLNVVGFDQVTIILS